MFPRVGNIGRLHSDIDALIPEDATIEVLAMGFTWSEGPVWIPDADGGLPPHSLLFSDIPNNRIHCWNAQNGLSVFLEPAGFTGPASYGRERGSNGLALDREGRLLCCEHGDRRISVLEKNGGKRTLADSWDGKRFNSPNDLAVHDSGAIYFTDPPYGLPGLEQSDAAEQGHNGVYRLDPDGTVSLLATQTRPNGIGLSPDERTLYVANSDQAPHKLWFAYDVQPDLTLSGKRVFHDANTSPEEGVPDGLAVDEQGNVFATGPGGVWVFAADGTLLGKISPPERPANVGFGEDGRSLFMTARTGLYRIRLASLGLVR